MTKILIDLLLKIVTKLDKEQIQEHNRIIDYLDTLLKNFTVLVEYDKHTQNELDFAHKKLRVFYQDIMITIGDLVDAQTLEKIKISMMSGRVLYHAICYSKIEDKDVKNDYEYRYNYYVNQEYYGLDLRQNSYEKFLKYMVKDGEVIDENDRKRRIGQIIEVCHEDIARITSLKEQVKTKLVFIVPL
jgi:predicted MPP superfamily phosphohydrolase